MLNQGDMEDNSVLQSVLQRKMASWREKFHDEILAQKFLQSTFISVDCFGYYSNTQPTIYWYNIGCFFHISVGI